MSDLWAALCLVLVIEGLFLFAAPRGWKRMAEQMQQVPDGTLRQFGVAMVGIGLVCLYLVRA
ncbi:MAG TPA: DUF2065 domain-containing protein [Xanthomonadaceae bacterium]|nr:DUF2065 domain-containing protein [Xanthomonadaceae bacterium]